MSAPRACATGEEEAGLGPFWGPAGPGCAEAGRVVACSLCGGCARLCLEAGFHGLGKRGRWLGKEAAWWALGHGGGRNAGGWALETGGGGGGGGGFALLVWLEDLGSISPRLAREDPKELGMSSERGT